MDPALPIYFQVEQILKKRIVRGEYKPEEKIPTESQLVEEFNTSRVTVRQAISKLVQDGFLISKRGLGTFVTNDKKLINSFSLEFLGVVDGIFYDLSTVKVKSAEISRVTPDNYVRKKLKLGETEEVTQIKRLRYKGDNLVAYTINYLPNEIGNRINKKMLYQKPLLQIIEIDFGIKFTGSLVSIEASFADNETSKYLNVTPGFPILLSERLLFTDNNKPIELVLSSHRGDMRKYIFSSKRMEIDGKEVWVQQRPEIE